MNANGFSLGEGGDFGNEIIHDEKVASYCFFVFSVKNLNIFDENGILSICNKYTE
jgi:hypothetical protein